MAWNDAAKTMAVNVIAKVEGGGAWDAINYNDPITLGLMQWYGTRAADLLTRIKADHPTEYATIAASLRNSHAGNADTSRYWTSRYITRAEGNTVKPVLRASKDTQGQLVASDVEDYKAVCERIGLNPDTNTNTAIFFMCMYHQSPARAINLMKKAGMSSNLDRVYSLCYNEIVFKRYRTRYTTAYNIIKSGVPPEIIDLNDDNEEQGDDPTTPGTGPDDDGSQSDFEKVRTGVKSIDYVGDQLVIHLSDGGRAFAVPATANSFILSAKYDGMDVPDRPTEPDDVDDTVDPEPDPPSGDAQVDIQNKLVKFMVDRTGKFGYTQGPQREQPGKTGMADCSSLIRFAFLSVTGKDVGTYTDAQVTNKNTRLIQRGKGPNGPNESLMKKGDLVITARHGTRAGRIASHVEMYMGGGRIIGHGGVPYMGPVQKDLQARTRDKRDWWIKRLNSL